jgi:hypothetical protein
MRATLAFLNDNDTIWNYGNIYYEDSQELLKLLSDPGNKVCFLICPGRHDASSDMFLLHDDCLFRVEMMLKREQIHDAQLKAIAAKAAQKAYNNIEELYAPPFFAPRP